MVAAAAPHRQLAPLHQSDPVAVHGDGDLAQEGDAVEGQAAEVPARHLEGLEDCRQPTQGAGQDVGGPALEVVDEGVEGAVVGVARDHTLVEFWEQREGRGAQGRRHQRRPPSVAASSRHMPRGNVSHCSQFPKAGNVLATF